ncbi:LysR substrate-binding domain-containing protein [Streptomyces sp. NPDC002490]|uniref:LysR substrate-binding domain-containing protein n=1 Tax=Streptomyces sp. NPDC002490 TaxID=3154416 RepID=UPI00332E9E4B
MSALDDGRRALDDARDARLGQVSIASETLLTVARVLGGFRTTQPLADVRLFQSDGEEMSRQLRSGQVDFCVASQRLSGPRLKSIELGREECLLAVPLGHRLDGRDRVTVPELADEPFVTMRPGHLQRTFLDRLFAVHGLVPRLSCVGDEPGASQDMVSAGLGIGLIPAMSRRLGTSTHVPVAWVRVDVPDCHRVLTLVWNEGSYLSPTALAFSEFITSRPFMTHRLPEQCPVGDRRRVGSSSRRAFGAGSGGFPADAMEGTADGARADRRSPPCRGLTGPAWPPRRARPPARPSCWRRCRTST